MRYLIQYKLYESNSSLLKDDISDMLLDLEDDGMIVDYHPVKNDSKTYEFIISKPDAYNKHKKASTFDVSNLVLWGEVKDVIRRITNYVIDNGASIRYFSDGMEWGITNNKKDFINEYDSDGISQFNLRILISENELVKENKNNQEDYENVIVDCLQDLIDDGFSIDLDLDGINSDSYSEIAIVKYDNPGIKLFSINDVREYIIDLNSHLKGIFNINIDGILYKEKVSYGLEDSMKAPQELDSGWRRVYIENINTITSNKIERMEIVLIKK